MASRSLFPTLVLRDVGLFPFGTICGNTHWGRSNGGPLTTFTVSTYVHVHVLVHVHVHVHVHSACARSRPAVQVSRESPNSAQ